MEQRVLQFHTDASEMRKAKATAKAIKEIAKLRKFLHKNQGHSFSEREKSHLFAAIEEHVTLFREAIADGKEEDASIGLLEDALKMPFTVFSTAHKKKMMKWYSQTGGTADTTGVDGGDMSPTGNVEELQIIDIDDKGRLSLMYESGDLKEGIGMAPSLAQDIDKIRDALDNGDDIRATVDLISLLVQEWRIVD